MPSLAVFLKRFCSPPGMGVPRRKQSADGALEDGFEIVARFDSRSFGLVEFFRKSGRKKRGTGLLKSQVLSPFLPAALRSLPTFTRLKKSSPKQVSTTPGNNSLGLYLNSVQRAS